MPHLNKLQEELGAQGLVVVGVTDEGMGLIEKHVEKVKMRFPVARIKGKIDRLYGVKGFPHSALVDPNGRVAWVGHPGRLPEDKLKQLLEDAAFVSPVEGKAYKSVNKHLSKQNFGKALAEARKQLAKKPDDAGFKELDERLTSLLEGKLAKAEAAQDAGEYCAAWAALSEVSTLYSGTEEAKLAKASAKELEKRAEAKPMISAMKLIQKADAVAFTGEFEKALKNYSSIAKKYPETPAGKRANEFVRRHGG